MSESDLPATDAELVPPPPSPLSASLEDLLRYQESLWRRGLRLLVEELLSQRPTLRERPSDLLELICNEVVLREDVGDTPSLVEYQQRFPDLAKELHIQWQVDKFLASRNSARSRRTGTAPSGGTSEGTAGPRHLGRYKVEAVLGKGGMGVAYRAWDSELQRLVALKTLRAGEQADETERERFRTEAEAIARVRHPNVVTVFDVGEHDGQPFFAMEYCAGGSLAERLAGSPLPPLQAAGLLEQIARGVDAAHRRHILHRDLKPANVLLTMPEDRPLPSDATALPDAATEHGCPSDAVPKVTDFGLAKKLDDGGPTRTGAVLGTPSYMAPEQASGKELGPGCDIYALGAILYECLTGRPPFKAATVMDTLLLVVTQEPVPPSRLNPTVPADLETITLKCLNKEVAKRYSCAADLADDIRRFLAGEPIQARPVGRLTRVVKWARRRPAAAALVVVSVLALISILGGGAFFTWSLFRLLQRAEKAEIEANNRAADEQKQRERAENSTHALQLDLIQRAWADCDLVQAEQLFEQVDGPMQQTWEMGYVRAQWQHLVRTFKGHKGRVYGVAFSPDGNSIFSAGHDGNVCGWDVRTGQPGPVLRGNGRSVLSLAISPDGKHLFCGASDGTIRGWDLQAGKQKHQLGGHKGEVNSVLFSPDGKLLFSGGTDNTICIWDPLTGKQLRTLEGASSGVLRLAISRDGKLLASGCHSGDLQLWDVPSARLLRSFPGHATQVYGLAFAPTGRHLLSASTDYRTPKMWELDSGKNVPPPATTTRVCSLAWSNNFKLIVCGSMDGLLEVWDAQNRTRKLTIKAHTGDYDTVALAPDGSRIVSGGDDGLVRLWDPNVSNGLRGNLSLNAGTADVQVAFSPDGTRFLTGGVNGMVVLWDTRSGGEQKILHVHKASVRGLAFSPHGKRVASASEDRALMVWDAESGKELLSLQGPEGGINCVIFNPDGSALVSGDADGKVRVWDASTGEIKFTLEGHQGPVWGVAYSADGKHLFSGGQDGTVILWDTLTGKSRSRLRGHTGAVHSVASSPDGRLLSGGEDGTVRVWDPLAGEEQYVLNRHTGPVLCVAVGPGGRRFFSGGKDGTLRVWAASTGQQKLALPARGENGSWVCSLAVSPDGTGLLSGSADGLVQLWDTRGEPARQLTSISTPGFVRTVAAAPDNKHLYVGCEDGTVRLWNTQAGEEILAWQAQAGRVYSVAVSPDGKTVLSGGWDRLAHVWDARTGQEKFTLRGHLTGVESVAFSPDGEQLVTGGADQTVKVWDARTGKLTNSFRAHDDGVCAVAFGPAGERLVTVGRDGKIQVWDTQKWQLQRSFQRTRKEVLSVAFSPDGKSVLTGDVDGAVCLWDALTGRQKLAMEMPGYVYSVAFDPDGRQFFAGCANGTVQAWDTRTGQTVFSVKRHKGYVFSLAVSSDGKCLFSGGLDGTVRMWDSLTGRLQRSLLGQPSWVRLKQ